MKVIDRQFGEGGQSAVLTEIFEDQGHKLKIVIRSDSHNFQSYAKILRWNGEAWRLVYSIHYIKMKTPAGISYRRDSNKVKLMSADKKRLHKVAMEILS